MNPNAKLAILCLLDEAEEVAARDRLRLQLAERDAERAASELDNVRPKRAVKRFQWPPSAKTCAKRPFGSEAAALRSCATLGHTVRAYKCPDCKSYHITKNVNS
jgi:hypothetical protein